MTIETMAELTLDVYLEHIEMDGDASKCCICDEKIFGRMINYFVFVGNNCNPKEIGIKVHKECETITLP